MSEDHLDTAVADGSGSQIRIIVSHHDAGVVGLEVGLVLGEVESVNLEAS